MSATELPWAVLLPGELSSINERGERPQAQRMAARVDDISANPPFAKAFLFGRYPVQCVTLKEVTTLLSTLGGDLPSDAQMQEAAKGPKGLPGGADLLLPTGVGKQAATKMWMLLNFETGTEESLSQIDIEQVPARPVKGWMFLDTNVLEFVRRGAAFALWGGPQDPRPVQRRQQDSPYMNVGFRLVLPNAGGPSRTIADFGAQQPSPP